MLFSPLDSDRFHQRIGKAHVSQLDDVQEILAGSSEEDLDLLIARCPCNQIPAVHAMEAAGFRWMDTLVYMVRPIAQDDRQNVDGIRKANHQDVDAVESIARSAFGDYVGHYHADARLDREAVKEIYPDWSRRAMSIPGVADCVLVAEDDEVVSGFAILNLMKDACCNGMLYGVAPAFQGRGVFKRLLRASFNWAVENGCAAMEYSTQLNNTAALRGVTREGFVMQRAVHTFHRWKMES
ncbi:GNAT family N-acetyltransferase [Acidovorax sp. NCPPB 2350]|nr:GNAT family N-acetyltransferase [Acidovorax sp. NCPPB 2350]